MLLLVHLQPGLAATHQISHSTNPTPGDIGWQSGFSVNGVDQSVEAITTDGKIIYIGGNFPMAGDAVVYGIALWNGAAWHALGEKVFAAVIALADDGRGHLYASGKLNQQTIIAR